MTSPNGKRSISELEYAIEVLDVEPEKMSKFEFYKFILRADAQKILLYVGKGKWHKNVVETYPGAGDVVGGGKICLDFDSATRQTPLIVEDFSHDFRGIPPFICAYFRGLLIPKLQSMGVAAVERATAEDEVKFKTGLNTFWLQFKEIADAK